MKKKPKQLKVLVITSHILNLAFLVLLTTFLTNLYFSKIKTTLQRYNSNSEK